MASKKTETQFNELLNQSLSSIKVSHAVIRRLYSLSDKITDVALKKEINDLAAKLLEASDEELQIVEKVMKD